MTHQTTHKSVEGPKPWDGGPHSADQVFVNHINMNHLARKAVLHLPVSTCNPRWFVKGGKTESN